MVRGLLVEIKNWITGERAYGINPKDPNLIALGGTLWQSLDHEPKGDFEIRIVKDNRDLSQYNGKIILDDGNEVYHVSDIPPDAEIIDVAGAVVLQDETEINLALDHIPDKIYGRYELIESWAIRNRITIRSVIEELKELTPHVAKDGHKKVSDKRKKPLEHILFGHPIYAFIKYVHEKGCPYTWKESIPRV